MHTKPKILNTKTIAKSRLFEIEEVSLEFSNGNSRIFERLKGRLAGAVMILPLLDQDTVLLIREYGVGIEDYYLSLPKGIMEEGEELIVAANRELKEEIGYGAHKFTPLKRLATAPGYIRGAGMRLLLAEDLYPEKLKGDEPEEIEVVPWRLSQLNELLAREDFCEARSVAALLMLRERLHGG